MNPPLTPSLGIRVPAPGAEPTTAPAPQTAPACHATPETLSYAAVLAVMRFMRWAIEQEDFPSVDEASAAFALPADTATRWTRALAQTYGVDVDAIRAGGTGKAPPSEHRRNRR